MIQLPDSYPLQHVGIEFVKALGLKESWWRRWLLQLRSLLGQQVRARAHARTRCAVRGRC